MMGCALGYDTNEKRIFVPRARCIFKSLCVTYIRFETMVLTKTNQSDCSPQVTNIPLVYRVYPCVRISFGAKEVSLKYVCFDPFCFLFLIVYIRV